MSDQTPTPPPVDVEAVRARVGREAHEAWMRRVVENGYPNHPWEPGHFCGVPTQLHHPDMMAWEELPEGKRMQYSEIAMIGYEAGRRDVERRWMDCAVGLNGALLYSFSHPSSHGVARVINRFLYGWDREMNPDPLDPIEQRLYDALVAIINPAAVAEATGGGVVSLTAAEAAFLQDVLSRAGPYMRFEHPMVHALRAKLRGSVGEESGE